MITLFKSLAVVRSPIPISILEPALMHTRITVVRLLPEPDTNEHVIALGCEFNMGRDREISNIHFRLMDNQGGITTVDRTDHMPFPVRHHAQVAVLEALHGTGVLRPGDWDSILKGISSSPNPMISLPVAMQFVAEHMLVPAESLLTIYDEQISNGSYSIRETGLLFYGLFLLPNSVFENWFNALPPDIVIPYKNMSCIVDRMLEIDIDRAMDSVETNLMNTMVSHLRQRFEYQYSSGVLRNMFLEICAEEDYNCKAYNKMRTKDAPRIVNANTFFLILSLAIPCFEFDQLEGVLTSIGSRGFLFPTHARLLYKWAEESIEASKKHATEDESDISSDTCSGDERSETPTFFGAEPKEVDIQSSVRPLSPCLLKPNQWISVCKFAFLHGVLSPQEYGNLATQLELPSQKITSLIDIALAGKRGGIVTTYLIPMFLQVLPKLSPEDAETLAKYSMSRFFLGEGMAIQERVAPLRATYPCVNVFFSISVMSELIVASGTSQISVEVILETMKRALPDPEHQRKITIIQRGVDQVKSIYTGQGLQNESLQERMIRIESTTRFNRKVINKIIENLPTPPKTIFEEFQIGCAAQ